MSLKMINKFSILFLIVVLSACSPINYDDAPDYNAYFPLHESDSSEYLVHEIQHTSLGTDTLRYFLKEVVKFGYIDGEGDLAFQFHPEHSGAQLVFQLSHPAGCGRLLQQTGELRAPV